MARVLLVEDEQGLRSSLAALLSYNGHEVREASSAREAFAVADAFAPDIVVADWMLKNDLHGLDVLERLSGANPRLRTILITGFPSAQLREAAVRGGVTAFLEKPFDFATFERAVARATATYSVACIHCGAHVLSAPQVGDAEARQLVDHLRACHPHLLQAQSDSDDPPLGKILGHFRFA
jgi:DNA-binding NtrC family response regulator